MACFIGGATRLVSPHATQGVVRPRQACSLPRGVLIRHAALPPNPPRFSRVYYFLTWFLGQLLEAFCCSKWVMRHIVGKLETSTFQRYNFCANWSLDERVMAPGSRGIRAIFLHFSGEDSDQTGEANGKPRVASWSWSCNLSYTLELADQIAASRKEFARKGGCPGGKTRQIFNPFFLFFVCVRAYFWRSSQRRFLTFLVPPERLCFPLP